MFDLRWEESVGVYVCGGMDHMSLTYASTLRDDAQ